MLGIEPTIGKDVLLTDTVLGAYTEIKDHCELESVSMGQFSYCAGYNQIFAAEIGNFCSIASFVRINPGNHPSYTRVAQHHFTYRRSLFGFGEDDEEFFAARRERKVVIGHDVWLGHGVTVMPGIKIGNGAVVGSGAVVTHDVEPYSVVAGVPAKKIKMRFDPDTIARLESTRWWEWDYAVIKERLEDFYSIPVFLEKYAPSTTTDESCDLR